MNKNYIRDGGKVRMCDSNIAKMNIFEGMYYFRKRICNDIKELYEHIKIAIIPLIVLFTLPLSFPYMVYYRIKQAKRAVDDE